MGVQGLPIGYWYAAQVKHYLPIHDARKALGREVVRTLLRDNDEMCVRDTVAMNQITDTLKRERGSHLSTDALRTVMMCAASASGKSVKWSICAFGMTTHSPGDVG